MTADLTIMAVALVLTAVILVWAHWAEAKTQKKENSCQYCGRAFLEGEERRNHEAECQEES